MTDNLPRMPDFSGMLSEVNAVARRKNNPAEFMHSRLMAMIAAHEKLLSDDEELGVYVVGGSAPAFHLRSIAYSNPDILRFTGKDADGHTVQLLQHYTQMGIMVVSMRKLGEKVYRIGFTPSA
ncbi:MULTISPECIES: hypothetical protein [unclassified Sinorhizobium]|uniref:hypothetical protein n=1 Tax=unclassified Sinorhizobium TaxID=2613772 RepID=UPI0024C3DF24|nr:MULTISPECIES: hypothetical protein [unclassified Sinorhizobium]MDK1377110.1 hypothetical protein [Sinorhizobium sp. 6-70]MDK1479595.1 hypothetical protein [Sinorhizobium sp. 6-117]